MQGLSGLSGYGNAVLYFIKPEDHTRLCRLRAILLGHDREAAYGLFRQLKGDPGLLASCPLHIDLMETASGLPVKTKSISCTLEELGFNCQLIAKEVFRLKNLEEMEEG